MSGNPYSLFGDPDHIASFSPRLNALANRLEARSARLKQCVQSMGFEGPKAERFRDRMTDARAQAVRISGDISELANRFILASVHEAQRIYEWEQAQERLEQGPMP